MITDPYGLDPEILQYSTLAPRSAPATGMGLGSPRVFPFHQGQPLDNSIWGVNFNAGATIEPNDGFLRFQASTTLQSAYASAGITRPFALGMVNVTIAFKLRVNDLGTQGGGLTFSFAPDLFLVFSAGVATYQHIIVTQAEELGRSNIKADGTWHSIVVTIQPGVVTVWEDDQPVVKWTPVTPLGETVSAYFAVDTPLGSSSLDVGDVTVLVGTTQQVRVRMSQADQSAFEARIPYLRSLAGFVADVETAAKPVTDILNRLIIGIGPSSLFWGLDPPRGGASAVRTFTNDARVTRLVNAARTANEFGNGQVVVYVGIAANFSFYGSLGAGIGFLIGTGPNPFTLLTITPNVGGVYNAGLQAVFDFAVFRGESPSSFLGWGSNVQFGFGEFFQGSLGISGNLPLHIGTFDNCGPALSAGIGLSVLPGDFGGGISYTWEIARL